MAHLNNVNNTVTLNTLVTVISENQAWAKNNWTLVQARRKHAPQSEFVSGYCSAAAPPNGFLMAPASGYCLQRHIDLGKNDFGQLLLTDCAAATVSIFSAVSAEKRCSHESTTWKERTKTSYSYYFPSEPLLEGFPCCFQPTTSTSKEDSNPACFILLE